MYTIYSRDFFFFNDPATTEIYTLSLHDALPISGFRTAGGRSAGDARCRGTTSVRSEEHTSELQSHSDLVCRLLLEKKKEVRRHFQSHLRILKTPGRQNRRVSFL